MSSGPPHEPIGADPNFNAAPRLIGTTWAMTTLSTVFVLMRLYTRAVIVKKVALDDYILIVATLFMWPTAALVQASCNWGLGRHVFFLPPENIVQALKWILISQPLGVLTGALGRISFAVTLLRLPGPYDRLKKATLYVIIIEQLLVNFAFIIVQFAQCGSQVNGIWDKSVAAKAHCWSRNVENDVGFLQSSLSVATDLALTVIPLWIIWNMQLKIAIKISLAFLLGLSIFAMIATLVKTIVIADVYKSPDVTVATVTLFIWAEVEGATVLIPASISALKPLFREIGPLMISSESRKAYKISSPRTNKSNLGKEKVVPTVRSPRNRGFEMLPTNNLHQEETQMKDRVSTRHESGYSEADESIVPGPIWEDEERGVLANVERLPAAESPPKPSSQFSGETSPDYNHEREPRIGV